MTRIEDIERKITAPPNVRVQSLDQLSEDTGFNLVGNLLSPATDVETSDPTDEAYTGVMTRGDAISFDGGTTWYNWAVVKNGLPSAGANTDGDFSAAFGLWKVNERGEVITGAGFQSAHSATLGAYSRLARRGYQVGSADTLEYAIEHQEATTGVNLITTNPGFETGSMATGYTASTNWSIATDYVSEGTYSAKTSSTDPLTSNKYAVSAGSVYRFGVYIRGASLSDTVIVTANYYDSTGGLVGSDVIYSGIPLYHFGERFKSFYCPSPATQAEISISATGNIWVDLLSISLISIYSAVVLTDAGVKLVEGSRELYWLGGTLRYPIIDANGNPTGSVSDVKFYDSNFYRPLITNPNTAIHPMDGLPYYQRMVPIECDFYNASATLQLGSGLAFSAIGAGAISAPSGEASHPGIVRFSQSGANTGYTFGIFTQFMVFDDDIVCEMIFRLQSTTALVARLGFQDSMNTAAPTDAAYIHIAGTTLDGRVYNAGGTSTTGTSYTVSDAIWYRLQVRVKQGIAYFKLWAAGTADPVWSNTVTSANVPDSTRASAVVGLAYKTSIGSADLIDIDYVCVYSFGVLR